MMPAHNWPDYLRTFEDERALAVAAAKMAFVVNPSTDAFLDSNGDLVFVQDGQFNGAVDPETSKLFGAQA
jgi:hypothetical protein